MRGSSWKVLAQFQLSHAPSLATAINLPSLIINPQKCLGLFVSATSLHVESDTEADYGRIRQMERPVSPAQSDSVADYRRYRQFGAWTYNGNGKEKSG